TSKLFFKVSPTIKLKKIIQTFAKKMDVDSKSYVYFFDGERIHESNTPLQLEIQDGDSIEAKLTTHGG
ncbi:sumo domain-containing protein ASCRUDRAFT_28139, partial [Ascoidea rubescens DSM 1968]